MSLGQAGRCSWLCLLWWYSQCWSANTNVDIIILKWASTGGHRRLGSGTGAKSGLGKTFKDIMISSVTSIQTALSIYHFQSVIKLLWNSNPHFCTCLGASTWTNSVYILFAEVIISGVFLIFLYSSHASQNRMFSSLYSVLRNSWKAAWPATGEWPKGINWGLWNFYHLQSVVDTDGAIQIFSSLFVVGFQLVFRGSLFEIDLSGEYTALALSFLHFHVNVLKRRLTHPHTGSPRVY